MCVNVRNHVVKQSFVKTCFHDYAQFYSSQYFQKAMEIYGHYSRSQHFIC